MLHPSYLDLIDIANENVQEGEDPIVTSRYSIILAASKRARQLIDGADPAIENAEDMKPLSIAVDELYKSKIHILRPTPEDLCDDEPGAELKAGMNAQESWQAEAEELDDEEENENENEDENDDDENKDSDSDEE